jgi:hypothetical protein
MPDEVRDRPFGLRRCRQSGVAEENPCSLVAVWSA